MGAILMWEVLTGFDPALLAAFIAAGLLLNMTPGVDFVFVSASGIGGGPKQGMAAALGINLGIAVHVVMAAAGISALLMATPIAYDVIRYLGAAYLVWLAWQTWRSADTLQLARGGGGFWRVVRRGFLTNILNPKTAIFIFAFIPQFTDPNIGPVGLQILFLGVVFLVFGLCFSLCLGAAAGSFAHLLRARSRLLNRISALMFGGLAARLVWQ
jgi:threonine/homoserine/homoserine lactone efflux protein